MSLPTFVVALDPEGRGRAILAEEIGSLAEIVVLGDLATGKRAAALQRATAVLARNTSKELREGEAGLLARARLIQFVTAGVDYIPLAGFPPGLPIAANAGAYAEPMAEHALALLLAAAKRLIVEHGKLARGNFDQFRPNRMLAGSVCGILGFGGIGVATARLLRAIGVKVHAINRSGATSAEVDWVGTPDHLPELLRTCDSLIIATPLTPATAGLIGARELARMKRDAVLVNLARGEIVDEAALYAHLVAHPSFTACIDAWWVEPVRHGRFEMGHPFLELPNVIASPHNSASVAGWRDMALRRALANVRRVLEGRSPINLVPPEDRML